MISNLNSIHHLNSFLPCTLTYSQVPVIRTKTSLGSNYTDIHDITFINLHQEEFIDK